MRGDRPLDAAAVEYRPDAIAVAREQPRERRDEIDQDGTLQTLRCAKIHGGAQVEQKPGGDIAIFDILADVRGRQARGDVPINIANIISGLILAQIGKIHSVAVKEAAVIALQQAIQPADDLPVETLQDTLRRGRGWRCAHVTAPRGPAYGPE